MKHKRLSWAQRQRNNVNKITRLRVLIRQSPRHNQARKQLRIAQSEMRQRHASTEARLRRESPRPGHTGH